MTEFWDWSGIGAALGTVWHEAEFHVRRCAIDFLKPFVLGDSIEANVRIARLGTSSITKRIELVNPATRDLCCGIDMVSVNVHLPTGRPVSLDRRVRAFLADLPG